MRIIQNWLIEHAYACEDDWCFAIVECLNGQRLDLCEELWENLIDVHQNEITFPSDYGSLMFEQFFQNWDDMAYQVISEKVS